MGLDEELETIEDGAETEAEQIDQETELEDVEEFQNDEEFDPSDDETDLEEAYEGFFAEEGPDGEGETSLDGEDGGLAAVASQAAGIDLSEEGFHIVDGDEADEEAQLYENGSLDSYDADALNEDGDATAGSVPEVDEANALEELEDGQDDDVQDVVIIEPSAEDDGYELVELELDDDDIVRYIEDEDGDVIRSEEHTSEWRTAQRRSTTPSKRTRKKPKKRTTPTIWASRRKVWPRPRTI